MRVNRAARVGSAASTELMILAQGLRTPRGVAFDAAPTVLETGAYGVAIRVRGPLSTVVFVSLFDPALLL